MKQKCYKWSKEKINETETVCNWLIEDNIMRLSYFNICFTLFLIEVSITNTFLFGGFKSRSPGSTFFYRFPGSKINHKNCWHFKGQGNSYPTLTRTASMSPGDWDQVVPSKLSSIPNQLASIRWWRFQPRPGDTMMTGQMKERPSITWSGNTRDLYTIMIVDEGIARLNGQQYTHWLVTNVPGTNE